MSTPLVVSVTNTVTQHMPYKQGSVPTEEQWSDTWDIASLRQQKMFREHVNCE